MRKCFFGAISALLVVFGCISKDKPKFTEEELAQLPFAQREGFPAASGGFVLEVGGETITAGEVMEAPMETSKGTTITLLESFRPIAQRSSFGQFKDYVRDKVERVVVSKISNILLYRQAKKAAGDNIEERLDKAVESELRKFISDFGGDSSRAEEALKGMGLDWPDFKEYQKKLILSQSYIATQLKGDRPVTYSELRGYYDETKEELFVRPARMKFRLIDIQIERLELADPNASRLEQARGLANELAGRIQGGEDFDELAKEYSGKQGVSWRIAETESAESLEAPYDILSGAAEQLEAGQAAGAIEAGEHIFIMKMEEKQAKSFEPFEEVQKQVEARLIFDRRVKAINALEAEFAEQAAAEEMDAFIDFCLQEIYRRSNEQMVND
jgi:parvulin-like peptidyl-prolyl isomerase